MIGLTLLGLYILGGSIATAIWVVMSDSHEHRILYFMTSPFWLATLIGKGLIALSTKVG